MEYQNAIREAQGLERLVDVMAAWTPNTPTPQNNTTEDPGAEVDWANRQALLAKCSYAVWLICDKNEVSQSNYRDAGGMEKLTALLSPTNDDTLLEMAAGAICALCEGCDANKVAFRESKGIEPLIDLLDHRSETVQLNASKALCHIAENPENRGIIRELGGLDRLVALLSR